MSLSELQCRNLIVKFSLQNFLEYKKPTIYPTIKKFEHQENVERKIGGGQKCALSSLKIRAALKKQTAVRSTKKLFAKINRFFGRIRTFE
jgi:hypothetical protein